MGGTKKISKGTIGKGNVNELTTLVVPVQTVFDSHRTGKNLQRVCTLHTGHVSPIFSSNVQ